MTDSNRWAKSTYSGNQTSCVEVRRGGTNVDLRDTKNRAAGQLSVGADAWHVFLGVVRR